MLLKILNLVALVLMIAVNYLANALPINEKTTGAVSAEYGNLFVPAGLTFSIWGVIYLLLIIFGIIQFFESNRTLLQSISLLFAISCVLNALWIFAWHYEQLGLSVIIMALLLASLILINIRLASFHNSLIKASFGIYLGWICIASIANISAWLVSFNWGAFGISHEIWANTMIVVGLLISAAAVYKFSNPFIALSVVWGFVGLVFKHQQSVVSIVWVALLSASLLLVFAVFMYIRKLIPISG